MLLATPLSYLWSNGNTDSITNALSAASYTVTVTDNNTGCEGFGTAIVGKSAIISVIADSSQTICYGGEPDGLLAVAQSSIGGVTYIWDNSLDFINATISNPVFVNLLNRDIAHMCTNILALKDLKAENFTVCQIRENETVRILKTQYLCYKISKDGRQKASFDSRGFVTNDNFAAMLIFGKFDDAFNRNVEEERDGDAEAHDEAHHAKGGGRHQGEGEETQEGGHRGI